MLGWEDGRIAWRLFVPCVHTPPPSRYVFILAAGAQRQGAKGALRAPLGGPWGALGGAWGNGGSKFWNLPKGFKPKGSRFWSLHGFEV